MKKTISVVALDPRAGSFYADEIQALFGKYVSVRMYSVRDGSAMGHLERADLFVVSTDAFDTTDEVQQHIPADCQVMGIEVSYRWSTIQKLREIPKGTRALFVNMTLKMAREGITQLEHLGVNHLELIAYENPAFGEQLDDLMQQYRLSPACKVACSADGITLAQEDTTKTVEQLRQAEHAGQLPETDLFTILREWDTASGTALVPLMTEDGFSAAIATKTNLSAALSPDAVSGLCWLRGDNYPEQFSTESGSYTVSSAKTQLSAEKLPDGFHVTAAIFLEGEGDFEAASQEIARLCQAAFRETVSEYHADVFDVEPCLWSQCYKDMEQSDWKTAAGQMHFSVQVNPHKNML